MKQTAYLIRTRLDKLGLSQAELSRKLNITPQFVTNWLNREHIYPPKEMFREISKHLGIPLETLIRARVKDFESSLRDKTFNL